jgi:hypothetical protein
LEKREEGELARLCAREVAASNEEVDGTWLGTIRVRVLSLAIGHSHPGEPGPRRARMEHLSSDHVLSNVDGTLIFVVRRPPTRDVLTALEGRIHAAARAQQAPLAYLHVVLDVPTTGKVDEDTRSAFITGAKRSLHHFEGAAMVLMRDGFAGAAMRAMVTGALMVVRPSVPVRIFAKVEDGVQWLSRGLPAQGPPRDPERLASTAQEMSAALLEGYAP